MTVRRFLLVFASASPLMLVSASNAQETTAEPLNTDSVAVETAEIDPVDIEPVTTEPDAPEPIDIEPVTTEPDVPEPIDIEPVTVETVDTDPAVNKPIVSDPVIETETIFRRGTVIPPQPTATFGFTDQAAAIQSASDVRSSQRSVAELRQARALERANQRRARIEYNLWMGYEPLRPRWNSIPMMSSRYSNNRIYVPVYVYPR